MSSEPERRTKSNAVHLMWMLTVLVATLILSMTLIDLGARFTNLSESEVASYSKVANGGIVVWIIFFTWSLLRWWFDKGGDR